ncbi:hypothetical protein F511_20771 [Dorcoceras hygrometricum]|uniref:Uncharacterized protein n=1 Tax=Dorcoceras hygrometricum TaxID=472368 RepID=A0A2Z7AE00_9LAMI|nr:hypothetical protein F511_20771 [Dorcoceras hygrometricum]
MRKRHVLVTVTHMGTNSKSSLCIYWFIDVSTGFDDLIEKAGFVATEYYTNGIELRLLVVRLSSISRENLFIPRRTVDTLYLLIEEAGFEAVGVYPITICMKLNLASKRCEYILIWEINTQHDTWNSYRLRWKFHQNQRLALINKIEFEYWEHREY